MTSSTDEADVCEWRISNGWVVYGEKTILESVFRFSTAYRLVTEHNELLATRARLVAAEAALADAKQRNAYGIAATDDARAEADRYAKRAEIAEAQLADANAELAELREHERIFGEHDHDSAGDYRFTCKRCWVLDEDAVLAALDTAQAELADANKRIEELETGGQQ